MGRNSCSPIAVPTSSELLFPAVDPAAAAAFFRADPQPQAGRLAPGEPTRQGGHNGSVHPEYHSVASYARHLRPQLPPGAFRTDPNRLALVVINLAILVLGWAMADQLDRWPGFWPLAFLPFALVMGNSVIVLLFATHDLLHGSSLRGRAWRRVAGLFGLALLWMPPTLWQAVHNREHHGATNSLGDPDRSYLESQPASWGKWIQYQFTPSDTVRPLWLVVGLANSWVVHNLRTLASVLLFNDGVPNFTPASFRVSPKERLLIALELLVIVALHAGVIVWLDCQPLKLLLGYFIPLWIGYGVAIAYIYTNHLLCPLTEINDPLANTLSLRLPRIFDLLHLNFSYHTEHHIFPGLNSSYYPLVQRLLLEQFPDRYQLLDGAEAWRLLLSTPRHYRDAQTLTTWSGDRQMPVPRLLGSSTGYGPGLGRLGRGQVAEAGELGFK